MINWMYFPRSNQPTPTAVQVVSVFQKVASSIDSAKHEHSSNQVLALVCQGLADSGFRVERGKKKADTIPVPVLFGLNGKLEKSFNADAYHEAEGFVVEVEAGRGVINNQFLKDLFQASMMHSVDYLAIAVRNTYKGFNDFDIVCRFFETLYASRRLELPLKGILIIGY